MGFLISLQYVLTGSTGSCGTPAPPLGGTRGESSSKWHFLLVNAFQLLLYTLEVENAASTFVLLGHNKDVAAPISTTAWSSSGSKVRGWQVSNRKITTAEFSCRVLLAVIVLGAANRRGFWRGPTVSPVTFNQKTHQLQQPDEKWTLHKMTPEEADISPYGRCLDSIMTLLRGKGSGEGGLCSELLRSRTRLEVNASSVSWQCKRSGEACAGSKGGLHMVVMSIFLVCFGFEV